MVGIKQPAQILLLTTEIGGPVNITNTLSIDTENWTGHNIQPNMVYFQQATRLVHSDRKQLPIRRFNSCIDIYRSGRNIDNRTGINLWGPIVTMILESNRENNSEISDLVRKKLHLAYRVSPRHVQ